MVICCAGIIFGVTGRLAVQQVTHDNMAAVKTIGEEFATNSLPDSRSDIYKFETKLYKRVALSQVRENWENIYTLALWGGIIAGIIGSIIFFKHRPQLPLSTATGARGNLQQD